MSPGGVDAIADRHRLRSELLDRGWLSDRYEGREYSDEFEWPASIPVGDDPTALVTGTVIYLEPGVFWVFAPQDDEAWRPPVVVYPTADQLLIDLPVIETWRATGSRLAPKPWDAPARREA